LPATALLPAAAVKLLSSPEVAASLASALGVPPLPASSPLAAVWKLAISERKLLIAEIVVLARVWAIMIRWSGPLRSAATSCETMLETSRPDPMPAEVMAAMDGSWKLRRRAG
jgi:hypothetical protein